jgi:hypothetical protein
LDECAVSGNEVTNSLQAPELAIRHAQVEHAALAAIDAVSLLHDFVHERKYAAFRNDFLLRTGRVLLDFFRSTA